jgi:predicted secreted protein
MDDLPDELTVTVGDAATLRLPSLAAAGYMWEVEVDDERVVETTIRFQDAAAGGDPPAFAAHELLVVSGRSPGRARVHCRQRRSWEPSQSSADHTVTVVVVAATVQPSEKRSR